MTSRTRATGVRVDTAVDLHIKAATGALENARRAPGAALAPHWHAVAATRAALAQVEATREHTAMLRQVVERLADLDDHLTATLDTVALNIDRVDDTLNIRRRP